MGLRGRNSLLDKRCFFVTTTCYQKKPLIDISQGYSILENSLNFVSRKYDARVLGYVIMPNHLHLIVLFVEQTFISEYMRDFKKFTATRVRQQLEKLGKHDLVEQIRHESPNRAFQVWTHRFDDVWLESKDLVERKLDYVHCNPLQAHWGLAKTPEEYPYSSAKYYELDSQPNVEVTHYREFF